MHLPKDGPQGESNKTFMSKIIFLAETVSDWSHLQKKMSSRAGQINY